MWLLTPPFQGFFGCKKGCTDLQQKGGCQNYGPFLGVLNMRMDLVFRGPFLILKTIPVRTSQDQCL